MEETETPDPKAFERFEFNYNRIGVRSTIGLKNDF
jgi:hypothetical protein